METWMVMRKRETKMKEMLLMVTKMRKQMAVLTSDVFYFFFVSRFFCELCPWYLCILSAYGL